MITEIISNCSCCGLPCCLSTSAPLWKYTWTAPYGSACYQSSAPRTYNLRDIGFPYKNQDNDIVNLKDFSCFAEDGFGYRWNLGGISSGQVNTGISGEIDEEGVLVGLPTSISVYCRYGAVGTLTCSRKKIGSLDTAADVRGPFVYNFIDKLTIGSSGCIQSNSPTAYGLPFNWSLNTTYEFCNVYNITLYNNSSPMQTLFFDFYFAWYLSIPSDPFDIRIALDSGNASSASSFSVAFKQGLERGQNKRCTGEAITELDYYSGVLTNDTHDSCPTTRKFTITLTPTPVPDSNPFLNLRSWSYSIRWHVPYK